MTDDIVQKSGNTNVEIRHLDLSSLASVRAFAAGILESESRLDVLINNAGCAGYTERKLTEDGLEYQMQTNYFGHFLLTNLLLGMHPSSYCLIDYAVSLAKQKLYDSNVQSKIEMKDRRLFWRVSDWAAIRIREIFLLLQWQGCWKNRLRRASSACHPLATIGPKSWTWIIWIRKRATIHRMFIWSPNCVRSCLPVIWHHWLKIAVRLVSSAWNLYDWNSLLPFCSLFTSPLNLCLINQVWLLIVCIPDAWRLGSSSVRHTGSLFPVTYSWNSFSRYYTLTIQFDAMAEEQRSPISFTLPSVGIGDK